MLAQPGAHHAGGIRPEDARAAGLGVGTHPDRVVHRDVLDVEHGQGDAGIDHFEQAVDHVRRGDAAQHGVGTGGRDRIAHRIEHRQAGDLGAALARRDAADDRRPAGHHALGEEPPGRAGDALHQDLRVRIDQDAHAACPDAAARDRASTLSVASRSDGL